MRYQQRVERLRSLAEAAPHDTPWRHSADVVVTTAGLIGGSIKADGVYETLAYIAEASPPVVLGLLDRIAELEAQLAAAAPEGGDEQP